MTRRRLKIVIQGLRVISRHRLRSGLLIVMATLGVDGVVCSVNYGAGGPRQILDQIRRMGTNVLIVTPTHSRAIAGRERTGVLQFFPICELHGSADRSRRVCGL